MGLFRGVGRLVSFAFALLGLVFRKKCLEYESNCVFILLYSCLSLFWFMKPRKKKKKNIFGDTGLSLSLHIMLKYMISNILYYGIMDGISVYNIVVLLRVCALLGCVRVSI